MSAGNGPNNDIVAVLPGSDMKVIYELETGSPGLRGGSPYILMVAASLEDISNF
jgi:hypothetical protein